MVMRIEPVDVALTGKALIHDQVGLVQWEGFQFVEQAAMVVTSEMLPESFRQYTGNPEF